MKRLLIFALSLGALTAAIQPPLAAAEANDEQQLIQVLQSDASPQAKDAACARLKRIGMAKSVPALAALLADEQLSHSARYVLEPMSAPEAGQALINALPKTAGVTKAGIINSLGFRAEVKAVSALADALKDSDAAIASASARALGRIGSADGLRALETARTSSSGQFHEAVIDGLLLCANKLLSAGDSAKVIPVFQKLYESEQKPSVRMAAFRGMILASGKDGLGLMSRAITGSSGPSQAAAVQLIHDLKDPAATKRIAALLPRLSTPVQAAVIDGLSQRDDPAAVPDILALASSSAPEVRLAVINALGLLGDASVVRMLAEAATSPNAGEQAAARQALLQLRRGNIADGLLKELATAPAAVQAELARALGDRGEKGSMPKLVELAEKGPESARKAAFEALALLADQPQLASMVRLVTEARGEATQKQATEALNTAFQQVQTKRGRVDPAPLVAALNSGSPEARIALLPVCSGLADPQVRAVLQKAVADTNPQIRAAAIRALCDSIDGEALLDLTKLACEEKQESLRTLAIGACVRLVTSEEAARLSTAQRLEPLKTIMGSNISAEQTRKVLAGLGEIPDAQTAKLIEPLIDNPALRAEACLAASKIAPGLADSQQAIALLKKVMAVTTEATTRQAADAALKQIEARADYVTSWGVAGPYQQAGKDFSALFDVPFPPEAGEAQNVKWQTLPACADPKRPWSMDLLKALGGEQCVAYGRTWVYSAQQQPAILEIGSDDGVKVWLNNKLVHSHNIPRALQPGADKANVTLNAGWNQLLFKVTQNNQGWEFSAKFVKPDGSRFTGLQFDAAHVP